MTSPDPDAALFHGADAYERFMGRYSRPLARGLARAAGVRAGERVLDVGCGTGALTSVLAEIVGPDRVAAADPSDPFVARCRARLPGVDVRIGSAEALPFEDRSFDCVVSELVFHFVRDQLAGARELVRVTRRAGRVAACVWDFTGGMTLLRAYWDAALEVDPGAPDESGRFGGKRGELVSLWQEAGLCEVADVALEISSAYRDYDELWQSILGGVGPVGAHAVSLDEARRAALREALFRRLGAPAGAFTLGARAWCAVGVVER